MTRVPQRGLEGADGSSQLDGAVLVRGVVLATYFADEENRPSTEGSYEPKNVCCDILTYGGRHRALLHRVPVMQVRHGLNDYVSTWSPRASRMNISTGKPPVFGRTGNIVAEDPRDFDGDHVIVDFLENDPAQPVVMGALAHPRATFRQVKSDGDGLRTRFRGAILSLDQNGNARLDLTRANDGAVTPDTGAEVPANDALHGRLTVLVGQHTTLDVQGVAPDGVTKTFELSLKDGEFEVRLNDGASLKVTGKDAAAVHVIGNGAMSAAIAEHMQTLWAKLQLWASTQLSVATGMGPSSPSTVPAPDWDPAINSTKLRLPDG